MCSASTTRSTSESFPGRGRRRHRLAWFATRRRARSRRSVTPLLTLSATRYSPSGAWSSSCCCHEGGLFEGRLEGTNGNDLQSSQRREEGIGQTQLSQNQSANSARRHQQSNSRG